MPDTQETMTPRVAVFVEPTPNPNSLKFIVGREITSQGSYEYAQPEEAKNSFLAARIFEIDGVDGVFIGRDFVTVRKKAEASWSEIESHAIDLIEEAVSGTRPVVAEKKAEDVEHGDDVEGIIRRILDLEIRPAVASDGGDVVYQGYKDGILTLKLVGACSGCPSSLMTLRMGIERRLREDVPELKEVVSLAM